MLWLMLISVLAHVAWRADPGHDAPMKFWYGLGLPAVAGVPPIFYLMVSKPILW